MSKNKNAQEEGPSEDKFKLDGIESKKRESEYKTFELPTPMSQLGTVIRLEFKQYFKSPKLILLYIIAILVPVLQMCNLDIIGTFSLFTQALSGGSSLTPLQYMHYCMILMPTVMVLAMAVLCGKTISQEYSGKTCFLNLPLPVDRWIFFTGKFIAITVTSLSVMLVGYGFSMIATNMKYGMMSYGPVGESLVVGIFAMLALIATGMFCSSICKKHGTILSLSLIMFIIPLIPLAISLILNQSTLPGYCDIFLYTPPFATDLMLIVFGWDPTMSLSGLCIGNMFNKVPNILGSVIASFLWAVVFFAAGIYMFKRREV